jgi:large subunit ribosomal protein L4
MSARYFSSDLKEYKQQVFPVLEDFLANPLLVSQTIQAELSNLRHSIAHTKVRSEVSGGGKKPWKQKGTGRARHGSTRSPIWVKGGVAHGPRNTVNWHKKINKSARVSTLKSLLKDRLDGKNIFVLNTETEFNKTKDCSELFDKVNQKLSSKTKEFVIIYSASDKEKTLGFSNLEVDFLNSQNLKLFKLAKAKNYILTTQALAELETKITKK